MFKVIDLMINVGTMWDSTCTTVTRPTGGCIQPSDRAERLTQDLSLLRDQMRETLFRA